MLENLVPALRATRVQNRVPARGAARAVKTVSQKMLLICASPFVLSTINFVIIPNI